MEKVVVKVTNIQPATAKIENIRWEVLEDEDFANDYAAGLISYKFKKCLKV